MTNSKMTKCKVCGAEMAKSSKACPSCGAKNKKKSILVGIIAVVVLVGIISTSGGDDEPKKVEVATTNQTENSDSVTNDVTEPTNDERTEFYVGETAELKGITVSLVNVTESSGSQFNTPTEGNVFVLCEFEIANNSDKEITVSSMMSFEAYCDDYACTYSLGALMEKGNKNQLDGTVAAGKKFNGVIGYEVPVDWKELEVVFTPDVWSGKEITFIATK